MKHHLTFYVGTHHENFLNKINEHLEVLKENNIEFEVFDRTDKLLPTLCTDGECVVGFEKIKNRLLALTNQ